MPRAVPVPAAAAAAALLALLLLTTSGASGASAAGRAVPLGRLSEDEHGVKGDVYALSARLVEVRGFEYDGGGPDAYFWADTGAAATAGGVVVPERPACGQAKLRRFQAGSTVVLELPVELSEVGYLSVWCRLFGVQFGGLEIDPAKVAALPATPATELTCGAAGAEGAAGAAAPGSGGEFAVRAGWSCETLLKDEFQARWRVDGAAISVELVGRIDDAQYMGFGPSGSDAATVMIGSDPAIVLRGADGNYTALDYHMSARSSCSAGVGVCADETVGSAADDLSDVVGERKGDLVRVAYSRPMAAQDAAHDRPFRASGDTFISWALGPVSLLDSGARLPGYHELKTVPKGESVSFAFGRPADAAGCKPLVARAAAEPAANGSASQGAKADSCSVTFKGQTKSFGACRLGVSSAVDVYWNVDEAKGEVTTLFSAAPPAGGYVGWGWGRSEMVPGSAVIAFADPDTGAPVVKDYSMTGRSSGGVQPASNQGSISGVVGDVAGGRVSGMFTRKLSGGVVNGMTDAIWAVGPKVSGRTALSEHTTRDTGRFDLSERTATAGETTGVTLRKVFKVHAWMMGIAWLVLAPLGIIAMRFFKKLNPVTFRAHQGLLFIAFVVVVAAYAIAAAKAERKHKAHFSIGTVVLVLAVLQVLLGMLRPAKQAPKRKIFALLHSNGGRLCWTLAVVNVFIGLDIIKASTVIMVLAGVAVGLTLLAFAGLSLLPRQFPTKEGMAAVPSSSTSGEGAAGAL
jgi:hypothetical protein